MKLDRMRDTKKLMEVWVESSRHPVRMGRRLFPDRPKGYVTATRDLGHYASNRAAMLSCRQRGDKQGTRCYRLICDAILDRLPSYAVALVLR